ncbi:MAG: transcriptional regulator, LysR family [Gemmatimonadetes bacterium]|nr:transcriptional regulator, LysR family [Gemmatimonadota bacterium]
MPIALQLEIRHFRLMSAIADLGTVTGAARVLNLTQSALSHQLADLELRLETPLFVRTTRRMVPTATGERMLATARRVLAEIETAERDLSTGAYAGAGLVRIATECYTAYHWLPSIVCEFRKSWPDVEVRIVPEATGDPIGALEEGSLDIAIVQGARHGSRIDSTPLFDDEMVVIMAPTHPLAARKSVTAADFAGEHLILYSSQSESSVLRDVVRPSGVEPRRVSRVQLTEAIIEMVKADLGVSVLARWAVAPYLGARTLVARPLTAKGFWRTWTAATIAGTAPAPPYIGDFLTLLSRQTLAGPERRRLRLAKG